jgi:hypothetical protein
MIILDYPRRLGRIKPLATQASPDLDLGIAMAGREVPKSG